MITQFRVLLLKLNTFDLSVFQVYLFVCGLSLYQALGDEPQLKPEAMQYSELADPKINNSHTLRNV